MTRKETKEWLENIGVENPSKDQIDSAMAHFNKAKEEAQAEIPPFDKEGYKKQLEAEFDEKLKGYISIEEHNKTVEELNGLKGAKAKDDRYKKYKELGAVDDESVLEFLDAKFSKSEKIEEEMKAYLEAHKNFAANNNNPNPAPKKEPIGKVGGGGKPNPDGPQNLRDALAAELNLN